MSEKKKTGIASALLVLVAFAWGTSYAITKDVLNQVKPFTLMSTRFGGSAVVLTVAYLAKMGKVRKEDIKRGLIIGIFMFLGFLCLIIGIQHTTASKQSFLIGSYVLIVPFLGWLINKKRPDKYAIIGASCAVIGLGMLTLGGFEGINKGDVITVVCAVAFAMHMLMVEKYCRQSDPIVLTIMQFWVTAILFTLLAFTMEEHNFEVLKQAKAQVSYLILVTTVLAFVVQNVAQRYVSSTSTALILTLESIFGSVFAMMYLKESMTWIMVLGCIIVLIGIVTQETKWEFLKNKKRVSDS